LALLITAISMLLATGIKDAEERNNNDLQRQRFVGNHDTENGVTPPSSSDLDWDGKQKLDYGDGLCDYSTSGCYEVQ